MAPLAGYQRHDGEVHENPEPKQKPRPIAGVSKVVPCITLTLSWLLCRSRAYARLDHTFSSQVYPAWSAYSCRSCRNDLYPPMNSFEFFHAFLNPQTFSPRARNSANTTSIPRLSIMRMPLEVSRNDTKRFSLSTQKRWLCKFGRNRRLVRFFAWETLLPVAGRFPVT